MLIQVDTRRPLKFSRKAESPEGDEVTLEIKYKMLFKHCSTCGMLTHEKEYCPSLDVKNRIQPQTERHGVFTRVQVPLDQRHNQSISHQNNGTQPRYGNEISHGRFNQSRGSRYGSSDRKYDEESNYRCSHSDRIMRRRDNHSRSNRYGGSRAGTEENVTKHLKEATRALSFPALIDQELQEGLGDKQIIGALSDMEIADPHDGEMMECDVRDDDLLGDFNEITYHNEKEGGRQRPDSSFLPFKQMLNDCGMLEFPFTGDMLSWVGKRAGGATVRCSLDRAVGNAEWHEKFPHSTVKYMRLWGSDHRPILADILIKPIRRSRKFKFDKRWLDNEELRQELSDALKAEELFWKQKSRVFWLREGDRNTKFFHALTKQRRSRNKITQLLDVNGNIVEDEEGLVAIATSYFRKIFESSNPDDIEDALSQVPASITGAMNDNLTALVSEWEIKLALFAMHPEKAPGPDGMTALFYQKFWDIVKEDLTLMVNKFLFEGTVTTGLNDSNICLIPKITRPNEMAQFTPISLCNVSYKIISKVLCQRLKKVLPGLISETQSAFVAGRQISDNIMIAQEMFHALRTKPSGRNKRMAIKIDMSKAYDRMEWSFIEAVKMGFSETWFTWIMRCITLVKYKRINVTMRQELKDVLGIQNEGGMRTYLGRWLSKGGKEVLIKSILLALPTYVMSTFLLPLEICENLASVIAQFWLSSNPPKRGIHWAKWEKVCLPREEGGIGFRMIHEFNLALLAKQLWMLVQFPDSLVARVLWGRYYRLSSPLRANTATSPSYVWTSISAARKLLLLGIRQKIHSGYEVKVSKEWDIGLLESYVSLEDIPLIRSLAISSTHSRDTFCWSYTRNGQYTVKSGYWVAQNVLKPSAEKEVLEPSITKLQAFVWQIKAPKKICHLIWQLLIDHVAVTRNLTRRNMRCDNYCPRCGELEETVTHAVFECPPALQVWSLSSTPTSPDIFTVSSVYTNMDYLFWRKNSIIKPELDMNQN
ncbi:PREDICTED: uncharacterized protein LOC106314671 [Brassica oleracea var. oleracea]|uniref:uncharacterized protein LOC106314671 n=1 Tax=Brassica oleracea var. oleracea TaxID=109376 RepID=UPI0006A74820|nr:PREDICTED: uncharacterized protein LOC106314671 [Brassica oleracea var. oleracea]